jgi:hypothetical protein
MLGVFAKFETNLRRERRLEGIAARQSGLGGDCRDIATDMRQTIPCVEIRCDRDGSGCRGRAVIMV